MSENIINPLSAKAEVFFCELKNVPRKIIDWLVMLTNGNDVTEKDFYDTQNIIDSIKKQNSFVCNWFEYFKPYFCFSDSILPECFDKVLCKQENVKSVSHYFDKKLGILNPSLLPILDYIKERILFDEDYRNAYQRAKDDALQRTSLKERVYYYMNLRDFQPKLIEEMEGIIVGKDDRDNLPVMVLGKDVYKEFYSFYPDVNYKGVYDDTPSYVKNKNTEKIFHCDDDIIEQDRRNKEIKRQPLTLTLAITLKNASSYEEIRKAEQELSSRHKDDNPENDPLRQIVFDSIENVINETGDLFLEVIRLSWFAARLEKIHDHILSTQIDLKQKLLEKSRKVMALLRKVLACQGEEALKKLATEASQYAFCLIRDYSGYGKVMKSYILALRYAVDPLVSTDLKCKYPTVSAEILRRLYFREDDEVSKKLRQDLANDFTDFLKPIPEKDKGDPKDRLQNYSEQERHMQGFDITKREPNPAWRYAYIRALVDLGIDNDGKGHFFHNVLDKVAKIDTSQMVRDAAKEASKELQSLRDGYASGSPKRHLLQAYWWLRRAHLQTLGVEINNEEALKVRVTEYR